MPISVAELLNERRTFTLPVGEDELTVTYNPQAYTPKAESEMQKFVGEGKPGTGLAQTLANVLLEWDLLEDGDPLPCDFETMTNLPTRFLVEVSNGIGNDIRVTAEERKNLDGGSRRTGRKGSFQSGSH